MKKQTILVVDDEPQWLQLVGRVFTGHDYHVLTAPSCAGALEALKSNWPDCAVLDFNLCAGDATRICAAISARKERRLPIVIFSSDPAAEECVVKKQADRFLAKTAPLEELFTVVNELLSGRVN